MSSDVDNPDKGSDSAAMQNIDTLRKQQEEETHFSWGKGFVFGLFGKFAGSGIAHAVAKSKQNEFVTTEVMRNPTLQTTLHTVTDAAEKKALIKEATKKAALGISGLRGWVLRNPGWLSLGGGAVGGAAALGFEYASHLSHKKEAEKNIADLDNLKGQWAERITAEKQTPLGHDR